MLRLQHLAKDADSYAVGGCPGVDLDLDALDFIVTGQQVDSDQVSNVLPGEVVLRLKPEIVIEAVRRYQEQMA
jgi:hypothetical protein